MQARAPALQLSGLRVEIEAGDRRLTPVADVSFQIGVNECVALLGESGCGKSMTALALMRLLPEGARVAAGALDLEGESLFALPEAAMQDVRGGRLAMIFQEPQTSLNPVMTVGQQIAESLRAHRPDADPQAVGRELLESVGLPIERLDAYPFQLSGGQRQRALIAMMLAGEPEVLIADEPTTALDVTVQAQILSLLKDLQRQRGMGLLLITHDLDVAGDMADRVAVMYAGQIVEYAPRDALYAQPRHPYTQKLFAVLPRLDRRGQRLDSLPGRVPAPDAAIVGCRFADRCPKVFERCRVEAPELLETLSGHAVRCHLFSPPSPSGGRDGDEGATVVLPAAVISASLPPLQGAPWPSCQGRSKGSEHAPRNPLLAPNPPPEGEGAKPVVLRLRDLSVHFPLRKGLLRRTVGHFKAVDGVSLSVAAGETLALVGESGCGKTTLARAVLRLIEPTGGLVEMGGEDVSRLSGEALRRKRREMQIVFQDPYSSLNPRMKVGAILEEGLLALLPELDRSSRNARIAQLLDQVGLPADALHRYPHEFSGGQRQRIAIARALAVEPRLLILDEPTSALDVSVQAQILNLLADIQAARGLSYLFITHNLPVVGYLAHRVAVMRAGKIVEEGLTERVLTQPESNYTRLLLDSAPGRTGRLS